MKREQLEHIIRAAAAITNEYEIVVVGSQSILGTFPQAPEGLLLSMEADLYPKNRPDLADLIDGAMGEDSAFHGTFGYYAQGVGPDTASLPKGWQDRLIRIQNQNTDLKVGLCLEPHDLAVAKLIAGREKDWSYLSSMMRASLVSPEVVLERLEQTDAQPAQIAKAKEWLGQWIGSPSVERREQER